MCCLFARAQWEPSEELCRKCCLSPAAQLALEDYIGGQDIYGRELQVTQVGAADELAAGASIVMGQTTEKTPVVLVRGYHPKEPMDDGLKGVGPLIRAKEFDLFR